MIAMDKWLRLNPFSILNNMLWKKTESSSGPEPDHPKESGSGLTPTFSLSRKNSTLTKFTSGRNTITIRTTSTPPQSKENTSNTSIETTSSNVTDAGSSKDTP